MSRKRNARCAICKSSNESNLLARANLVRYRFAFSKTDRHLHEQFLLQREWQPPRCRFEHVDPTPRQNAEQGFGLHVTGRERIREEPDEIDIQTCAISQHANFIRMQQKNVAFRIWFKLNRFVSPWIGAVGKLWQ
jgi:hypothetical protein